MMISSRLTLLEWLFGTAALKPYRENGDTSIPRLAALWLRGTGMLGLIAILYTSTQWIRSTFEVDRMEILLNESRMAADEFKLKAATLDSKLDDLLTLMSHADIRANSIPGIPATEPLARESVPAERKRLIALDQTVVANGATKELAKPVLLNVARTFSKEFSQDQLRVSLLSHAVGSPCMVTSENGKPFEIGDALTTTDLEHLSAVDTTDGRGGSCAIRYRVMDPDGNSDDATINVVFNPIPAAPMEHMR